MGFRLFGPSLRRAFSKVNAYYMPFDAAQLKAWGQGAPLRTEQLYARKNFFTGKWSVYKVECRNGWTTHASGASFGLQPPVKKKIVSGFSFEDVKTLMDNHESHPKVYVFPAGSYFKTDKPMKLIQDMPAKNYWRGIIAPGT